MDDQLSAGDPTEWETILALRRANRLVKTYNLPAVSSSYKVFTGCPSIDTLAQIWAAAVPAAAIIDTLTTPSPVTSVATASGKESQGQSLCATATKRPAYNTPVVETVSLRRIAPLADDFAFFAIDAFAQWASWETYVNHSSPPSACHSARTIYQSSGHHTPRDPRMPVTRRSRLPLDHSQELIRVGYIKARPPGGNLKAACPLFPVGRPDGKFRLIWDGRGLNAIIRRPPPTYLPPLHEDIDALTAPNVSTLWACDFTSWFVQLRTCRKVAHTYFNTARGATLWQMTGVPMGLSWAPVVAQAVTITLVREATRACGKAPISARAYIDNVATAFNNVDDQTAWVTSFLKVCTHFGADIKPSSITSGATIEWRGLVIDLNSQTVILKPEFRTKLNKATESIMTLIARNASMSPLDALSTVSLAIYATYSRRRPLADIPATMRWLTQLSTLTANAAIGTQQMGTVRANKQVASELHATRLIIENPTLLSLYRSPSAATLRRAFGVSDAAGEGGLRAYAFHTQMRMHLCVVNAPASLHIGAHELRALLEGILCGAEDGPAAWTWWGDNQGANHQADRYSWGVDQTHNNLLKRLHDVRAHSTISIVYCPSRSMPMDIYTRAGQPKVVTQQACSLHPGSPCDHFRDWLWELAPTQARHAWVKGPGWHTTFGFKHPTFALHHENRIFHDGQPAGAMRAENYHATADAPVPFMVQREKHHTESSNVGYGAPYARSARTRSKWCGCCSVR